jgi:hypothetical protein
MKRQLMKAGASLVLGIVLGCSPRPVAVRDYVVEDISTGKRTIEGTVYTDNRQLPQYTEYTDIGNDGLVDKVQRFEKGTGWNLGQVTLRDEVLFTDNMRLTQLRVPREEYNALMGFITVNYRYVLTNSEEARRLQEEFAAVRP